jgi:Domain of unknown function (DUF4145)
MAIDRSIWTTYVDEQFENSYPCPRCSKGRVRRGENAVVMVEPHHSKREHGNEEWDPDWIRMSFTTMLTCDYSPCGEIVAVGGRAGVEEYQEYGDYGEPTGSGYTTYLKPASMFPAPPLFPIAKSFPQKVQEELQLAFQLFWTDLSASTSRLRTSLERVLDSQGIATTFHDKNGNPKRLSLFDRIDLFEKASMDSDIAESMTALRVVGNLGTHGDEVTKGDYFDLLEVYEDALSEIFEQTTAKLKAKKLSLIALSKPK